MNEARRLPHNLGKRYHMPERAIYSAHTGLLGTCLEQECTESDILIMHVVLSRGRINRKLTNHHILCLAKHQPGLVSLVTFSNIVARH